MEKSLVLDLVIAILGLAILFIIAIMAIVDHNASDMVSAIPSSIVGGSLFIAGYVSFRSNKK